MDSADEITIEGVQQELGKCTITVNGVTQSINKAWKLVPGTEVSSRHLRGGGQQASPFLSTIFRLSQKENDSIRRLDKGGVWVELLKLM